MKAATKTLKRTTPEQPSIHTPLTLDDRDAVDALRRRIEWQAVLVQHTLATWNEDEDWLEDRQGSFARSTASAGRTAGSVQRRRRIYSDQYRTLDDGSRQMFRTLVNRLALDDRRYGGAR